VSGRSAVRNDGVALDRLRAWMGSHHDREFVIEHQNTIQGKRWAVVLKSSEIEDVGPESYDNLLQTVDVILSSWRWEMERRGLTA
jgi:hypothetical protein